MSLERLQALVDEGVLDAIYNQLKTGKEAEVWLVSHHGEPVAAKLYKEREFRSFKNDAAYREGRTVRNTRTQRAMDKGSKFGREQSEEAWKSAEVDAMFALHAAGVRVPKPVLFYEGTLLMEVIGDAEGRVAPRLVECAVAKDQAEPMYRQLRGEIIKMLSADWIHGDLSEFNVLMGVNGPVIIDFPQVITAAKNSRSEQFFRRDLGNMTRFFSAIDPSIAQKHAHDADEIWRAYVRRNLHAEFEPRAPRPAGAQGRRDDRNFRGQGPRGGSQQDQHPRGEQRGGPQQGHPRGQQHPRAEQRDGQPPPRGEQRSGQQQGQHPRSEQRGGQQHPRGEQRGGPQQQGQHPRAEQRDGQHPRGEQRGGQQQGQQARGEQRDGQQQGQRPRGGQQQGQQARGGAGQQQGQHPRGEQRGGQQQGQQARGGDNQHQGQQPRGEQRGGPQQQGQHPRGEPRGGQPQGQHPRGEQRGGSQQQGQPPRGDQRGPPQGQGRDARAPRQQQRRGPEVVFKKAPGGPEGPPQSQRPSRPTHQPRDPSRRG